MLQTGDQIGDWVIDRAVGEGAMGSVFLAHNHMIPDILAAVKIIKPGVVANTQERFFREVRTLHKLRHAAVVRVTGFGHDKARNLLFFAMEYVEGKELGALMDGGPMAPEVSIRMFTTLLEGLAHAHQLGIFHRDLKPSNVLVQSDGTPILVDFGVAIEEGYTRLTEANMMVGTLAYMAPEVFHEERVQPALGDTYAAGIMLFECLTGDVAFPDDPRLSARQRIGRMAAAKFRPRTFDPGPSVAHALREVVMTATACDPARRYASAAEFAAALQALPPRLLTDGPATEWVPAEAVRAAPPSSTPEAERANASQTPGEAALDADAPRATGAERPPNTRAGPRPASEAEAPDEPEKETPQPSEVAGTTENRTGHSPQTTVVPPAGHERPARRRLPAWLIPVLALTLLGCPAAAVCGGLLTPWGVRTEPPAEPQASTEQESTPPPLPEPLVADTATGPTDDTEVERVQVAEPVEALPAVPKVRPGFAAGSAEPEDDPTGANSTPTTEPQHTTQTFDLVLVLESSVKQVVVEHPGGVDTVARRALQTRYELPDMPIGDHRYNIRATFDGGAVRATSFEQQGPVPQKEAGITVACGYPARDTVSPRCRLCRFVPSSECKP